MKESFVLVISSVLCLLLVIAIFLAINLGEIKRYNEDWILGKTKEQVIEKYGEFEWYVPEKDAQEQVICYVGMYTLKPKRVVFGNTKHAIYFCIDFDMNGIAYECYEESAGKGG